MGVQSMKKFLAAAVAVVLIGVGVVLVSAPSGDTEVSTPQVHYELSNPEGPTVGDAYAAVGFIQKVHDTTVWYFVAHQAEVQRQQAAAALAASLRRSSSSSGGGGGSSGGGGGSCDRPARYDGINALPDSISNRESGGNYGACNESSGACGKYQFLDSTWAGAGGYRSACDAPPAVQDQRAAELWAGGGGCSHWSAC
jgi:hypothetical protein